MLRVLSFLALAAMVGAGSAYAQSEPTHKPKIAPATVAPADKGPDLPDGPLDVPRWMGHAVDNILSGDAGPDKPGAPTNQ